MLIIMVDAYQMWDVGKIPSKDKWLIYRWILWKDHTVLGTMMMVLSWMMTMVFSHTYDMM